jgi:hypothetical protein
MVGVVAFGHQQRYCAGCMLPGPSCVTLVTHMLASLLLLLLMNAQGRTQMLGSHEAGMRTWSSRRLVRV